MSIMAEMLLIFGYRNQSLPVYAITINDINILRASRFKVTAFTTIYDFYQKRNCIFTRNPSRVLETTFSWIHSYHKG